MSAATLGGPITSQQRAQLEFNLPRMFDHYAKTREQPVWMRVEHDGHEWRACEMVEHWEGADKLRVQFFRHPNQQLAPGVRGKGILIGARMPDGSTFGAGVAVPPKTAPEQQTLMARVRAAINRGADRVGLRKFLRDADINSNSI